MKRDMSFVRTAGWAWAALFVAALVLPATARADVERIREKALELEQKLNREQFAVEARVEEPGTERIYKDFDFILKKSKIEELAKDAAGDPHAEELRLFLIEAIVNKEIATYVDDLHRFEQESTVSLDGNEYRYADVMRMLATASEDSDRRKIYSALGPIFETSQVFRIEILNRRNETYAKWGFDNFAKFYSAREGTDLQQVSGAAQAFLDNTQALYDSLFAVMADRYLHTEPRKVRFYDLPYLTQGSIFEDDLPATQALGRMWDVFRGLGVDVEDQSNLEVDMQPRTGKRLATGVYPVVVPSEVEVSMTPVNSIRDDNELMYAVGEAEIFALSKQTAFEPAYLVNQAAQATLAYLPRLVLDEPTWIESMWQGDTAKLPEYLRYRAFADLYQARVLAAQVVFESMAYEGGADLEREFRSLFGDATGARIASADAKRALEYMNQLKAAGRFQGLLMATSLREHFRQQNGEQWFREGAMGPKLRELWGRGGTLTPADISAACDNVQASDAPLVRNIRLMLDHADSVN